MTAVDLTRIDAAQSMARFYRLDVQPILFGRWTLVTEHWPLSEVKRVLERVG